MAYATMGEGYGNFKNVSTMWDASYKEPFSETQALNVSMLFGHYPICISPGGGGGQGLNATHAIPWVA